MFLFWCSLLDFVVSVLQGYISAANHPQTPYFICCVLYGSQTANKKLAWIALVSLLVIAVIVIVVIAAVKKMLQLKRGETEIGRTNNFSGFSSDSPLNTTDVNGIPDYDFSLPTMPDHDNEDRWHVTRQAESNSMNGFHNGLAAPPPLTTFIENQTQRSYADNSEDTETESRNQQSLHYDRIFPVTMLATLDDRGAGNREPSEQTSNYDRLIPLFTQPKDQLTLTLSAEAAAETEITIDNIVELDTADCVVDSDSATESVKVPTNTLLSGGRTKSGRIKSIYPPESFRLAHK